MIFYSGISRWNIPYVFATNHGGTPEAEKGAILAEQLKLPITTEQMLLAHTPMKQLVSKYRDNLILVVGQTKQLTDTIMEAYVHGDGGFKFGPLLLHIFQCDANDMPLC